MKIGNFNKPLWMIALICILIPQFTFAQDVTINGANTAWVLTSTALVLFMTLPGLALFYSGLVRHKNVLSVTMQCFAIACLMSILWMVAGYALAFGNGGSLNNMIGLSKFFMDSVNLNSMTGDLPETVFFMFQMTFAIITPALIIGATAERMKFSAVLWFTSLWMLLVYAPVCHWVWGGGWLSKMGFLDFAGGAVVHVNAGVAALVAAVILGKRRGFPSVAMPPHNMTLVITGASMLWVGWFGFNAGSALAANANAGMAMTVTHISAAAGSLTWMSCEWLKHGKPSVLGIVTGMVAGLGTITPASGFVGPAGALIIGISAGVICYYSTQYVKRGLHIDDSLDVFPVHGVGGILGTLLTGVFAAETFGGLGLKVSMGSQVITQLTGIIATAAWCGVISYILLKIIDAMIGLRVTDEQEMEGLDLVSHDERGYNF
jgi:Amt family ammonium transporter